ncbi:transmembrane and immunoglobulin domain-containing protein 2 isoform X2 [Dicentrarchus labrax]|uniref:transmembrane and immunoglobulin domain-containing protein 2 isoform X2 n=1 Tax=Dicentrarchus labrax TaxID=13489 RepID=UPI0021F55174|nr:transmembrane and immunoglobulin domain-containing protein 2 isoform X2 [Dicentrarchus labrax]
MKLLLSSLLLASLCALSSWSVSSGTLVVTQTPAVSAMQGETVNVSCCWTWTGKPERMRVDWLKNQTSVKKDIFGLTNQSQGSLRMNTSDCLNLTFTNISREDSGRYTCKASVEIPLLVEFEGNGTVITVTAREARENTTDAAEDNSESSNSPPLPLIISVAAMVPLLLIALVCFCSLRRRQAQAARVIYEVPHTDSEVAEMDKHSTTSSRGSSQWCQVPVYESFDYFERVQTKE